jgi:hypothetical protein
MNDLPWATSAEIRSRHAAITAVVARHDPMQPELSVAYSDGEHA